MRLLKRNITGQLNLTKDLVGDILSHTWGTDIEEVSFQDLINGTGRDKPGYKKIWFCGEQARSDGLQYFWVDTCCIDKSSSAELSEAIISMFRWYHNAAICYVYLSDISRSALGVSNESNQQSLWESVFRKSRWFTRGWTLQELIAPPKVEFFSQDWEQLGDKKSLKRLICEITGIPARALQGDCLSDFSVNERLLWTEKRETTRNEDKAYSLLGIFNIQIPVLYGEGKENAFKRLLEEIDKPSKRALNSDSVLDRLPSAADAPFNSYNKQYAPTCLPDTRVNLLQEIYDWADGQHKQCIFWLNGLAGTGKSTIARTVARKYYKTRLGASFFFSRGGGDVSTTEKFVTSIARQLASRSPSLHNYVCESVRQQRDISNLSLDDQWRQLVLYPLSRLDSESCQSPYILVVDALDECDGEDHIGTIVRLFAEARFLKSTPLRIFVTSRPEIPIRHGFKDIPGYERHYFVLHNIPLEIVNRDISVFLTHEFTVLTKSYRLGSDWQGEETIQILVQKASGLFIWAATACRFVREKKLLASRRLSMLLRSGGSGTEPERKLDEIYLTVLANSVSSSFTDEEKSFIYSMMRSVLGSLATLFSPLSATSLSALLHIEKEDVNIALEDLYAILDIPENPCYTLRLHYPSFRDFLLDKERCNDSNFQVDERLMHRTLANDCIRLMLNSLKKDMFYSRLVFENAASHNRPRLFFLVLWLNGNFNNIQGGSRCHGLEPVGRLGPGQSHDLRCPTTLNRLCTDFVLTLNHCSNSTGPYDGLT